MAADDYHVITKHGKTTAASAVSPNSIKKPKERVPASPDMPEVNRYLMCQLCSGYLIDATGIVECQHTFCKSCILKYLETNTYCPICDVQLNKANPQYSLRSDIIIQRLVYKLVPGLLVSESRRRRDFYIKNDMESVAAAELAANSLAVEIEAASDLSTVLSLDDVVSLSIEYFRSSGSDDKTSTTTTSVSTKSTDLNGKQQQSTTTTAPSSATQSCQNQQQKSNVKTNNSSGGGTNTNASDISSITTTNANPSSTDNNNGSDNGNTSEQANDRRYLQCPAGVSVGLLKKFIRRKYGLSDDYRVDLLYNGNRDSILESDLTLLDVAFIYKWNKDDPMNFQYRIFERPPKTMTIYSGMKRPAPSMMDEPPDDDTASGPPNRSSMFSSSSAPSSKLPRLGDNTTSSQGNQGNVPKDNTSGKSTAATIATTSSAADPAPTSATGKSSASSSTTTITTPTTIKVEREEADEDDDDEDDEEDYETVERKEHMKGIKSSRKNSIKESMKRSVAAAASNLRCHISRSSSSSSHSTESKDSESGNENSLNSSSTNSGNVKRITNANLAKNKRANSYGPTTEGTGTGRPRGRPPKVAVDSLKLRVTSSDNNSQSSGSLKMSISTSGITPVVSSSPGDEKKEPLKLSLGSVLASKGAKSPDRKHHKRKHHHHKLRHRDKQSKGVSSSSSSSSSPNHQKPIKISFTLSPPGTATVQQSQNSKSSTSGIPTVAMIKPSQDSGEQQKGNKPLAGSQQNFNNSARTSSSAHGHLNNISKSISVSINTNVNSNNNPGNSGVAGNSNSNNKMSQQQQQQHGNKILSPAELIPKNTGIEIQPTTIPISSSHGQISQHQHHSMQHHQSGGNVPSNNTSSNSHKHSHPLLPDSVHVPKSVTLIPVNNPNAMGLSGMGSSSSNNNSGGGGGSSLEKGGSGSHHGNHQNRINSHTFTHPITNKSLHQITVTEVPPPQKTSGVGSSSSVGGGGSSSSSGMGNSSLGGNHNTGMANNSSGSNNNTTHLHSSISGTTSNPIEKVIASAANNKPQFNGPGSMEITKIYCGTSNNSKENPAKKLKDRRGLDISITGTGINVNVNKSSQKLEETLRQKVNNIAGGGSGSISVTPVAAPNSLGSGNSYCNNVITTTSGMNAMNKMKSVSATAASLLSGKMPPGITIGPATIPQNSSNNSGNSNVSNNTNMNMNSGGGGSGSASANVGNNIMKGLGFTLPPHLTAHPHNPNNIMKNVGNQGKSDNKMPANSAPTNNSRLLGKDSVSIIGKGNNNNASSLAGGQQQHQQPPPVEITISATGGNKSQSRGGINIVNKSKMNNDPLSSIFDITQGLRKSPTTQTVQQHINAKDNNLKQQQQQNSIQTSNAPQGGASSMNTKNMTNKRPYDMSASGNGAQTGNKKATKESSSPEMKKGRSTSTSSDSGTPAKQPGKTGEGEIPLDLSGRSTRTTPPLTIPQIREPSKSPSAANTTAAALLNEKRALSRSPETEKSGKVISPSSSASSSSASTNNKNFLSPKMNMNVNTPKNSAVEPFNNKGPQQQQQPSKSISVSKLSPNQASKIGSIVDNLAQKQAQAQQQQQQQQHLQNVKNSQAHHQQQQQHLQNVKNAQAQQQQQQHHSHHHHPSNVAFNPNSSNTHSNTNANNSGMSNLKPSQSNAGKSSSSSSAGMTSPITAPSSLTSPAMPITSSSPPGADHMRNLWTLSDTAVRQGKINSMNELLVAASLFSPPGHPHPLAGAAAAHQLAAAAAAASPTGAGANAFNSNIMAQFGHHLAALQANKIPPGMFDHHFMAALNAHNAHAAAAGMRMQHPFAGSMSPPLNLPPNAFFPHGGPTGSQQQSPIAASAAGSGKAPNAPSTNKSGNSGAGKSNSMPFGPLFSHSVPVSSPKSPNSGNLSASAGQTTVKPSTTSNSIPSPIHPFATNSATNSSMSNHHTGASGNSKDQKPMHSSIGKGSSSNLHNSSGSSGKSTKINGTMSTAMPVFPPGIHNPLLQPRPSNNTNSGSNSSGNSFQSGSSTAGTSLNKTFPSVAPQSSKSVSKGGIPNSMKISNFLPSKPKDSGSDANAEATITSGSNFGIPPLQSKPNFSLSPSRSSPSDSLSLNNSIHNSNNPKSPSFKEGPLSPVKSVAGSCATTTASASISPTNKPRSLTCASLLLPDSMYSKPAATHHLLNSLSPTKGDHGNMGLCSRSNRTPSSDSALLSPNSSPSSSSSHNKASTTKATSPGAPSFGFNKPPGSRSEDNNITSKSTTTTHRTISPTKEEMISKKEKGSIPMGASLARNFTPPTTSAISQQLPHSLSLTRPIPTIPAFFNRSTSSSSGATTSCPSMSSNANASINHHLHQHKNPSPARIPTTTTSPVKMGSSEQQHHHHLPQHLPSPIFPFPGVSVPVQVKLQDDNEEAVVTVAPTTITTTVSATSITTPSISLKSEVNKVMAAKEEKVEEKRKRSCSSPPPFGDSKPSQLTSQNPESSSSSKVNPLADKISSEIPPAKVQKMEIPSPISATAPCSVKNEMETQESLIISESQKCSRGSNSESVNKNAGTGSTKLESMERKESESQSSSQRESGKGGEQQGEEKMEKREGVADPSKELVSTESKQAPSTPTSLTEQSGISKVETEISSPVKTVETEEAAVVDVVTLSEKQTEMEIVAKPEQEESPAKNVISIEKEKSETQIAVDTACPKSDETSTQVNHHKSTSFEIPEEKENQKNCDQEIVEAEKTEEEAVEEDIDIEVVNEQEEQQSSSSPKPSEIPPVAEMDIVEDNQMEIDVDSTNEEKMVDVQGGKLVEERVTLTKEEDDFEVDIVDVDGVDEPMEVATDGILIPPQDNEHMEEEAPEKVDEVEEICIDNDNAESAPPITATNNHELENDDDDNSNLEIIELPENPSAALGNDGEESEMAEVKVVPEEGDEEPKALSQPAAAEQQETEEPSKEQDENDSANGSESQEKSSIFLPENESTTFSQDDSECGDLIIDLGEENEEEKDNKVEETEELVQVATFHISAADEPSQQEKITFERSEEEISTEVCVNEPPSSSPETLTKNEEIGVNEPSSSTSSINSQDESIQEQTDERSELSEEKEKEYVAPASPPHHLPDDDDHDHENFLMDSTKVVLANVELLDQDSILNQITINPAPIEVNGVIKADMESSEEREESEKIPLVPAAASLVSECPQPDLTDSANEKREEEKNEEEPSMDDHHAIVEEAECCELSGNAELVSSEENENTAEATVNAAEAAADSSQLDQVGSSPSPPEENLLTLPVLDNADNNNAAPEEDNEEEAMLVEFDQEDEESKIEEENSMNSEETATISVEIVTSAENVVGNEGEFVISLEEITTPIHFPENDNNMLDSENISVSVSDDIMEETTTSSMVVVTGEEEDMEGTPMETDDDGQEEIGVGADAAAVDEDDVQMIFTEAIASPCLDIISPTTTTATIVPNVDDVSMQIETDSVLPTDDSSTCVPTESNNVSDDDVVGSAATTTPAAAVQEEDEPNQNETPALVEEDATFISATVTCEDSRIDENSPSSPVPTSTPTTSTSSVAIKLDVSANNEGEADSNCDKAADSLSSPPSEITTTSSSLVVIPSSTNTSGSSSAALSSPVDVSPSTTTTTTAGLKSLETFGKVAAGLLASATSTINNNNNNTSLAPTTCDAISIATTNANA